MESRFGRSDDCKISMGHELSVSTCRLARAVFVDAVGATSLSEWPPIAHSAILHTALNWHVGALHSASPAGPNLTGNAP